MFTRNGKALTARAIKPIGKFQQVFKSTWLFGAYSPINGEHIELILPHCNADNFQLFLDEMSNEKPKELKIMVLDNGRFHKARKLKIPKNIVLLFLPPYSPELNPAEKIWERFKRSFTNKFYTTMKEVEDFISEEIVSITKNEVKKICGYSYIFPNNI